MAQRTRYSLVSAPAFWASACRSEASCGTARFIVIDEPTLAPPCICREDVILCIYIHQSRCNNLYDADVITSIVQNIIYRKDVIYTTDVIVYI